MSIFDDESFDKMDEISQLIEPLKSTLNDKFVSLPEKVEINIAFLIPHYKKFGERMHASELTADLIQQQNISLDSDEKYIIESMYKYDVQYEDEMKEITFDTDNNIQKGGQVWLVKKDYAIEEEVLIQYYTRFITNHFNEHLSKNLDVCKKRFNEVAEIFEIDKILKSKGLSDKRDFLTTAIIENLEKQTLKIKDVDLIKNLCRWIVAYIRSGNQSAYRNMILLKIQTHEGDAIYSIKEEQI